MENLTKEEQERIRNEEYLRDAQMQMDREQSNLLQKETWLENQTQGMLKEQLDLTSDLKLIEHLLKGEKKETNEDGDEVWVPSKDRNAQILSPEGVDFVMNTLHFYLNKNTLLANYEEETILAKMEDFSTSLNDALFMSYEKYFLKPTREEIKQAILKKFDNLIQDRLFFYEVQGITKTQEEVKAEIKVRMNYEHEIEKTREQLQKERLKGFDIMMRVIQDSVHSAYQRAWKGQERRSLREHMHVSESITPINKQSPSGNPLKRIFGR